MNRVYPIPDYIRYGEIVVKDERIYLKKPGIEVDVTGVYWFLKEMFTGEWRTNAKPE